MRYKKKGGVAPGSGKTQWNSIRQNQNGEVGRGGWEDRGREGAYGTFREWGARKGEIIWNVNKLYRIKKIKKCNKKKKKRKEKRSWAREMWLNLEEDWLLFWRSWVQIPATTWRLTTIYNGIRCPLLECLKRVTVYSYIKDFLFKKRKWFKQLEISHVPSRL